MMIMQKFSVVLSLMVITDEPVVIWNLAQYCSYVTNWKYDDNASFMGLSDKLTYSESVL
jgi:hypothetical protein